MASIGHLAILLALSVAITGAVASFSAGFLKIPELLPWGRRAVFGVLGLVASATAIMLFALVTHDFSLQYVAEVGSRETPLYYTIASLWGALDGSILLWALLLSVYSAVFLIISRAWLRNLQPYIIGILLSVSTFFLLVIAGPGNPFVTLNPAPADGPGPNPLLQNHWMMGVHPVLLYCGYVGLTIPFAIALAALIRGAPGPDAFRLIRRWALVPWIFLSLGVVAGMWWSYAVLGWGGYWSWDPVENVAVMPWLVTTAFLHSLQVQERRQMLKTWTVSLVIGAFLLSILGTFVTRSGILDSVHSFTQSGIGPYFLVFLALILLSSLGLLFARSRELATAGSLDGTICRETAFLFNNLLLVAVTFTILLGTLFSLIAEAVQGSRLSVGAPYFNQVNVPLGVAILFLMGVGPALPWGTSRLEELQYRYLAPVAAGVGCVLLLLLAGIRGVGALATMGLAAFVFWVTLERIIADIRARHGNTTERWDHATARLFRSNPRRYGGYLAHIGIVLIVIGIAASQAYVVRSTATLYPGQSMSVDGYRITYRGLRPQREPNRMVLAAAFDAKRGSQDLGTFLPSQNYYTASSQMVVTPAVREEPWATLSGLFSARSPVTDLVQVIHGRNPVEDLYLMLQAVDTSHANQHNAHRSVTVLAVVSPLVGLIWLGGFIVGLGGCFALMPPRRRRRLASATMEMARPRPEEAPV